MVKVRPIFVIAILVATIFISFRPFLHEGIASGHDIGAHATWLQMFMRAFREGQFPVRWVPQ